MRTFVIGDIHGAYHALLECLELSQFNKCKDRLICLGDVCDRGPQVKECIDELLTMPHLVYILGNHDIWALEWGIAPKVLTEWWVQGGAQTIESYKGAGMPREHIRFLSEARPYFLENNRLFVHGGFDPACPLKETPRDVFFWDRSLLKKAQEIQALSPDYRFGGYDEVFIGHTPTINFGSPVPRKFCNVWDLDTGAGCGGRLTIMNVDTKEFWQSEPAR